mgnify:CR=1 FL=1
MPCSINPPAPDDTDVVGSTVNAASEIEELPNIAPVVDKFAMARKPTCVTPVEASSANASPLVSADDEHNPTKST